MMSFIWFLIIGGLLGWIASMILGRDVPGGVIGNIIGGIVGAWLGSMLLGNWGWRVSDFYVFPALIGSIIVVFLVSFLMRSLRRAA